MEPEHKVTTETSEPEPTGHRWAFTLLFLLVSGTSGLVSWILAAFTINQTVLNIFFATNIFFFLFGLNAIFTGRIGRAFLYAIAPTPAIILITYLVFVALR